jgi:hypothetical protein
VAQRESCVSKVNLIKHLSSGFQYTGVHGVPLTVSRHTLAQWQIFQFIHVTYDRQLLQATAEAMRMGLVNESGFFVHASMSSAGTA